MKQKWIDGYVFVSAVIAIATTLLEMQPALFFIEFLAPNPGDSYNLVFVLLMTFLVFLLPLLVVLLGMRLVRNAPSEIIATDRTGVFVMRQKALASALVGIPVYIDDKKMGVVDNGKTLFFELSAGMYTLQAGTGKQASEKLELTLSENEQINIDLRINQDKLFPKVELVMAKE